jgi:L-malate glycosyltransferase
MNITLVTQLYPTVNRPDLFLDTAAIHYFAKEWVKQGHRVTVFHMYLHDFKDVRRYRLHFGWKVTENILDGVSVHMMENRLFGRFKHITEIQMAFAAHNFNKIITKLGEQDVLLVHLPCMLDDFVERLKLNCPRIAVLHNADIKRFSNETVDIEKVKKQYKAFGYRSQSIKENFHDLTTYDGEEFIAYSGAPSLIRSSPQQINQTKEVLKILYVGKLIPLKKVDITLKALARIKDDVNFHFTIVGDGQKKNSLESLTKELGINHLVTFKGNIPREEVLEEMKGSDVFVMVSSPETFGLVYIEAMSCGCITIGSKGEGIDGVIVNDYNGYLITPGDIFELSDCLIKIQNKSYKEYILLRERAIDTGQNMTEEKMAEQYIENVKQIIKK